MRMLDRKHIERVLKINGVMPTAQDEEIRSVLLNAHYRDDEVTAALTLLHTSGDAAPEIAPNSLNTIMRSDRNLNAKEISKLLGIDIVLPTAASRSTKVSERTLSLGHHIVIWSLAVLIAALGIGLSMYALEFGLFHPATAFTFYE